MNWGKTILAGIVGGIALNISDFIMHGMIMADTYRKHSTVFEQEQANPMFFVLIAVCIGIAAALLFAKTRSSWAAGPKGGAVFGAFLGLVLFFPGFYNPVVIADFPYHLAWCWGGINFIGLVILGAVMGLILKKA